MVDVEQDLQRKRAENVAFLPGDVLRAAVFQKLDMCRRQVVDHDLDLAFLVRGLDRRANPTARATVKAGDPRKVRIALNQSRGGLLGYDHLAGIVHHVEDLHLRGDLGHMDFEVVHGRHDVRLGDVPEASDFALVAHQRGHGFRETHPQMPNSATFRSAIALIRSRTVPLARVPTPSAVW